MSNISKKTGSNRLNSIHVLNQLLLKWTAQAHQVMVKSHYLF